MTQETTEELQTQQEKPEKLWTPSFLILWQSQLVSTLGDAVYSIALGFWVLSVTGSTALMGTLMAVSTLPGVLVSPFAGVIVDRQNRKKLLILMDMIRGVSIVLLAIAAYSGLIAVWMVFVAGILLSICGAVFGPGVNSSVPDMVPKSKLSNANSLFMSVATGSNMIGSAAGGFIYQALGAPFLFIFNGLSFLFSGISIFFVKIPKVEHKVKQHFMEDMRDGFKFMWRLKGLRHVLMMAAVINFFSNVAIVLFLPMCQTTPSLGAGKYGVAMACFTGGMMLGFITGSIIHIKPQNKAKIFFLSMVISMISVITSINQPIYLVMLILLVLSGFSNAIVNVLLITTTQAATPSELRGKVMAFINMTCSGLVPFAMALGGVLGSIFPIRAVISFSFLIVLISIIPFSFVKSFRKFINCDFEKNSVEDIIEGKI
jgi:MFS transporter, DHA3 family, macrolide efflux protein